MKILRKYFAVALASIFMLVLISACGSSFKYDKEATIKSAQELIEIINTKDYQAVIEMLPQNLQSQLSAEKLRDAWDGPLSSSGSFTKFESATTSGVTQNSINYVVVIVPCKYEKGTLTFTITYTTDLKIAALEMR